MKTMQHFTFKVQERKGAVAVIVALCIVMLIGFVALAVDVGYMMTTKNEAQNAADAAALAGARRMGQNYHDSTEPTLNVEGVAKGAAGQNKVAGLSLAVDNLEITTGHWIPPFDGGAPPDPNAVWAEVTRKEGLTGGRINTFLARVLDINDYKMKATACAALSGPCEGKPSIPLGIGKGWFDIHPGEEACGPEIKLNATGTSCAGWTNLSMDDKQIQKDVEKMFDGTQAMPDKIIAGNNVQFIGGTITPILEAMKTRFLDPSIDIADKTFNADGTVKDWTTYVVVYNAPCGSNPNDDYTVLGFAKLTITEVVPTPYNDAAGVTHEKGVVAKVVCGISEVVRGGCFYAGTLGTIPGLVK